jgi:D-glycero-alpha-D-manno-heptose-7-phosphate kinase
VAIVASAPVRICDIGGWTDTWFGGPGRVLNVAVTPGVEVTIRPLDGPGPVVINAESFGERYRIVPGEKRMPHHPLLEAALDSFPPPTDVAVEVRIRSRVPPGCSTGTSAAVVVALLGALAAVRDQQMHAPEVAYAAHRLEVDVLHGECGIQDQLSSALGGINYLEIDEYPEATVRSLPRWNELGARLTLVYLGRAHDSSAVHRQVIAGAAHRGSAALDALRHAAAAARDAVLARDLAAFGQAMIDNTEAQRSLHAELIGEDAARLIELAKSRGTIGWKVNGAGGDGGSISLLSASPEEKHHLEHQLSSSSSTHRIIPIELSSVGLHIRTAESHLTASANRDPGVIAAPTISDGSPLNEERNQAGRPGSLP